MFTILYLKLIIVKKSLGGRLGNGWKIAYAARIHFVFSGYIEMHYYQGKITALYEFKLTLVYVSL